MNGIKKRMNGIKKGQLLVVNYNIRKTQIRIGLDSHGHMLKMCGKVYKTSSDFSYQFDGSIRLYCPEAERSFLFLAVDLKRIKEIIVPSPVIFNIKNLSF